MTDTDTDFDDIILDTDLELEEEEDGLGYDDFDALDLIDLDHDDEDNNERKTNNRNPDHSKISSGISKYSEEMIRKGPKPVSRASSSSSTSLSATLQYVMESIQPDTEASEDEFHPHNIQTQAMNIISDVEGFMDDTDNEDNIIRTPAPTDRSIRERALEQSMQMRLDKLSQRFDEWKHKHDEFVGVEVHRSHQLSQHDELEDEVPKRHQTSTERKSTRAGDEMRRNDFRKNDLEEGYDNPKKYQHNSYNNTELKDQFANEEATNRDSHASQRTPSFANLSSRKAETYMKRNQSTNEVNSVSPNSDRGSPLTSSSAYRRQLKIATHINRLKEKCTSQQEEIGSLKSDLLRARKKINILKEESDSALRDRDMKLKELQVLYEKTISDTQKKEKLLDEHLTALSEDRKAQSLKAKRQSEIAIDLRKKLNSKVDENKQLDKALKAKDIEFKEKEKAYSVLHKRYSDVLSQQKDTKHSLEEMQTEVYNLQSTNADLQKKLSEKDSNLQAQIQSLTSSKRALEDKITKLEETISDLHQANQRESLRLSMSQKEQTENLQRDVLEWKQNYKELSEDMERIKREQEIKLRSAEDVFNTKLNEVLERERRYKEQNRALEKKVEELLEKSLVNEQYLTEQIEWKNKYEHETNKWRTERLIWENERLELEDALKSFKEIQNLDHEKFRSEIEKYKNMLHKEKFQREAVERRINELKKSMEEREQFQMEKNKNEEMAHTKLIDIRKGQQRLEKNFQDLQQRLSSYMHKYNQTLREMNQLRELHTKMLVELKEDHKDFGQTSDDESSTTYSSSDDDESEYDRRVKRPLHRNDSKKETVDRSVLAIQNKCDDSLKEYKTKMSSLIKDMKNHGQEISSLRQAFQTLKTRVSPTEYSDGTVNQPKRSSMYNNYIISSDDEKQILSDFSDQSDAEEEEESDREEKQKSSAKSRSKSVDITEKRHKCVTKPPVPVQERNKAVKKKKKQLSTTASRTTTLQDKIPSKNKSAPSTSVPKTKKK